MADDRWIDQVRQAGVLRFSSAQSLHGGAWPSVLTASVAELNAILQNKNVGLRFEPASGANGTQIQIEATTGPIPASAGGGTLDPTGRHGATRLQSVGRAGDDSSLRARFAWIFLPTSPGGSRRRPPRGLMQVMLVHELLHASGLEDHAPLGSDDVMAGSMEDGSGGKVHPWGGSGQDMPPCQLGGGTVTRLVALWGQRQRTP
jgi:hypothetical protein